ncbi:Uncharacterized protein TCAP_03095 [Tolypocladium capitatum]|uniref:Zn(2)-C6 fungal-type domain-containing protein n=1 Tax=Tolypocladium capitatum TaxID=45235 RepID=A0A2K3QHJ3_9HYPO|nr:Uncharacterized protein TCAP_03095 [Tolypocladium capitatum]
MADNVIRKACDRCHSQKLSCKRVGDEACERCVRLHAECKSSPSLRYKKQQQQQQQQQKQHHQQQQQQHQQQQHQQLQHQQLNQQHPTTLPQTVVVGRRSPKRRRTGSELCPVQPKTGPITPHTADLATAHHSVVGPDTALELSDFNFDFEQLAFLTPPQADHLPHTVLPGTVDAFQAPTSFTEPWEQQLAPSADPFPQIGAPSSFSPAGSSQVHRIVPTIVPRRRPCAPEHGAQDTRRQRQRAKHRPRQIALRQAAHAPTQSREAPTIHWMAQLSDINARLLDLSSVLPQQQGPACDGRAAEVASGFPIDEMFKLTRRVADILDRLSGTGPGDEGRLDGSDPGNSMFVLSTYVRLLDMYQRVFNLVRVELLQADARAAFRFWKLPDVTVGSFAVESTPSLQMSLTIQLAEEFLVRLRNATAALDPALRSGEEKAAVGGGGGTDGANGSSMFSDVVDVSYRAVRTKEESLGRHLAELRDEIEAFLDC